MRILVTGAKGMVGTALCNNLKNIRDGKNKTRPNIHIEESLFLKQLKYSFANFRIFSTIIISSQHGESHELVKHFQNKQCKTRKSM